MKRGALFKAGGRGHWLRVVALVVGIVLPQVWMLWSSLIGATVMLPVDSFAAGVPGLYEWVTEKELYDLGPPKWPVGQDGILFSEPMRRYAVSELHAGRVPAWNPYNYAGVAFIGNGQSGVFSPYRLIEYLSMDPVVLAWSQLAKALVAGIGMYLFLRYGLRVSWFAAAAGAWIYPLTGFMTVWVGIPPSVGATWIGWVLWATEMTVRRGGLVWPAAMGVATCFLVFAGHPQLMGHTLILSGVYAVWRIGSEYYRKREVWVWARRMGACGLGWGLGLGLAAVQVLPLVLYTLESNRMLLRQSGVIERPAQGYWALLQVVAPWICGDQSPSSVYLLTTSRYEGGSAGYGGLLVFFVLVPLAWGLKRWRGQASFWGVIAVLGVSAVVGIPVLGKLVSLPPLGMLSSNRLTCLTAFALAVLGAVGVNAALRGARWGRVWMIWVVAALGVAGFLWAQMGSLGERVAPMAGSLTIGTTLEQVVGWFEWQYGVTIGLLLVSAVLFAVVVMGRHRRLVVGLVVVLAVAEMAWMAMPGVPRVERRWYPDGAGVAAGLVGVGGGRVLPVSTLVSNMNLWWGIESVTGYDALDPVEMMRLLRSAAVRPVAQPHAAMVEFGPVVRTGVLRALNVKYLASFEPMEGLGRLVVSSPMFYVYELPGAMPRAYVPRHVRWVREPEEVLGMMNHPAFNPEELGLVVSGGKADVERGLDGVVGSASARMIEPGRTEVTVEMETPGMVVLADAYARGWEARYNGAPVEILKANYALRGVVVPAGKGVVEFVYKPRDLRWGLFITCGAVAVLLGLGVHGWFSSRRKDA
jgi:hypothetical protein